MFCVGDKIVHPMHGAGVIESIVDEKIGRDLVRFYVFRMPVSGLTLKIPTANSEMIGVRAVSSAETIERVLAELPKLSVDMTTNWNHRYRENMERIKSGDLLEVGSSDALHPVDAIVSRATCFEKNGLEINGVVDSSDPIRLDSGVCSFTGKGSGYNTDECYWQVTKYNDVTHDGIREIQFDAVCYIPDSSIPYFGQTYDTYISSELYDAYTGTWLTASTARGDTCLLYTSDAADD